MKKSVYIICLCCLSVLVYHEVKVNMINYTSSRYIPTARLLSSVKHENSEAAKKKVVYLTFDDGPSEVTPIILDVLKDKKVKASFFLVGSEISKEREEIVRRTVKEGHSVGVHAYNHSANHLYCSKKNFLDDFNKAKSRIEEVTGKKVLVHRFPWGSNGKYVNWIFKDVHSELKKMNIRSYDWNCSGDDAINNVTEESIIRNVRKNLGKHKYTVILLHDYCGAKKTAKVLGKIIDMLKEKGYRFENLDHAPELLFKQCYRE